MEIVVVFDHDHGRIMLVLEAHEFSRSGQVHELKLRVSDSSKDHGKK